jgi:hypothetical protein
MKSVSRPVAALAFVLAFAAAPMLFAQNNGPAANGDFTFDVASSSKRLVFDARIQNNGSTRGQIVLTGDDDLGDQDVDGGGDTNPGGAQTGFSLTADVDCLNIDDEFNRAVMGGVITDSSEPGYIGVRTLLVVQDGGEGSKKPIDRFTWGLYRGATLTWIASDAELLVDPGVGAPPWLVSDAELTIDPNAYMSSDNSGGTIDCNSFRLAAYDLRDVAHGAGNIQVKP